MSEEQDSANPTTIPSEEKINPPPSSEEEGQPSSENTNAVPPITPVINNPVRFTTELMANQYTELLSNSTNHDVKQQEYLQNIDNIIESLLKRCDEIGENIDGLHSNSSQIREELLPQLLNMMRIIKELYQKIDHASEIVSKAKEKVNSLDTKLTEFEKQKTSDKFGKYISIFSKFTKSESTPSSEPKISFNKEDYIL